MTSLLKRLLTVRFIKCVFIATIGYSNSVLSDYQEGSKAFYQNDFVKAAIKYIKDMRVIVMAPKIFDTSAWDPIGSFVLKMRNHHHDDEGLIEHTPPNSQSIIII